MSEIIKHKGEQIDESGELMQLARLQLASINGLSEQMGVLNARVSKQDERLAKVEEMVDGVKAEMTVTRAQANRIQSSIHGRVAQMLKIEREGGRVADSSLDADVRYRGGFISRLYNDARRKSKLGTPYYMTLRSDFSEVMEYIEAWVPEVDGGVEGYKHYLDIRREERRKNQ